MRFCLPAFAVFLTATFGAGGRVTLAKHHVGTDIHAVASGDREDRKVSREREEQERLAARRRQYLRPLVVPYPIDNAYTPDRALLGKTLFFDPRLSGSGSVSCATCHNPGLGWGDGMAKAVGAGMKQLGRRTPTIVNLAWSDSLMWDGRAGSLEAQALLPITSEREMDQSLEAILQVLKGSAEYREMFARAYPGEPIDEHTLARAVATFERTVVTANAPFDQWVKGKSAAIPVNAIRGFALFNGMARCSLCHSGWNFADDGFHDIGVDSADLGRGAKLPLPAMQYAFKTPTLRNIGRRAPYMHDGSEQTLEQVIELYDRGGKVRRDSLSPEIVPLHLSPDEKKDLVAFLRSLTSEDNPTFLPVLPR